MLKILKNCYSLRLTLLANKNIYRFGGAHDEHHHDDHHHEIDRESIKLRDEKTGKDQHKNRLLFEPQRSSEKNFENHLPVR